LTYFWVVWYIFGNFGIFSPFWYIVTRKIWQPWLRTLFPIGLRAWPVVVGGIRWN
jgi:hypothetical protein